MAAIVGSLLVSTPSGATPSHPGGVADTCPEVLSHEPTGGLEKLTAPPSGSEVPRGAVITVTLRWDRHAFDGGSLHKVLDCVTVDGDAADGLSVQVRDPENVGEFALAVTVPDDLPDGTRLCDRGFVSGTAPDGSFVREKSNDVCFTVRGESPPRTGRPTETIAPTAPGSPAPEAPAPVVALPGPTPTMTVPEPPSSVPPLVPAPVVEVIFSPAPSVDDAGVGPAGGEATGADAPGTTEVAGITEVADEAAPTLPRTGTSVLPLTAGGLGAMAAGLLTLFAGRLGDSARKRAGASVAD